MFALVRPYPGARVTKAGILMPLYLGCQISRKALSGALRAWSFDHPLGWSSGLPSSARSPSSTASCPISAGRDRRGRRPPSSSSPASSTSTPCCCTTNSRAAPEQPPLAAAPRRVRSHPDARGFDFSFNPKQQSSGLRSRRLPVHRAPTRAFSCSAHRRRQEPSRQALAHEACRWATRSSS